MLMLMALMLPGLIRPKREVKDLLHDDAYAIWLYKNHTWILYTNSCDDNFHDIYNMLRCSYFLQ